MEIAKKYFSKLKLIEKTISITLFSMTTDKAVFNHVWKFLSADVSTIMTRKSSSLKTNAEVILQQYKFDLK